MFKQKGLSIVAIKSDHEGELKNDNFQNLLWQLWYKPYFFLLPEQHNKMVLLRERIVFLQEMALTMLNLNSTPKYFWAEVTNATCYLHNRIYIKS